MLLIIFAMNNIFFLEVDAFIAVVGDFGLRRRSTTIHAIHTQLIIIKDDIVQQ